MFSSRLHWDSNPNPISELLNRKRQEGAQILDLTESNPTRAGFQYPAEAILSAFTDPRALVYEPDPRGLRSARELVSRYYADRGVETSVDRILLTASTSEAYSFLFKLLCDPGDEILVPRPSYPLFEFLAAMESVKIRQYPLRYDGTWHIDFDSLDRLTSPRAKAIVVVNPNNPTGSYLKTEEWQRLQDFAAERGLAILSDEVFSDFGFGSDATRVPTLASGSPKVLTFSMSGLSKIAGLPQMKLGWIIAAGPRADEAIAGLEWIADTYLSVATPVQYALPELLKAGTSVRSQMKERTSANLRVLEHALGEASPAHILAIEGGWYATLQVPRTRTEEQWTLDLLNKHGVLVQPGFFYDFESEAYLILSLLTAPGVFLEGVRRLVQELAV
jgi:aspartate/methionine/tyrosine aminotransferase